MKKFTLFAVSGLMAFAAQAQFNCDPSTSEVIKKGIKSLDYIMLSDQAVEDVTKAGAKVTYIGPDPAAGRNFWIWSNTFVGTDNFNPRVDMYEGQAMSLMVNNADWSGGGFAIATTNDAGATVPGANFSHFDENTIFHMAYMCPNGNMPPAVGIVLLDGSGEGSQPAKFSLGGSFEVEGQLAPVVGDKFSDDWQGLEISLGNLKKFWPAFDLQNKSNWTGNAMSILAGGVVGRTVAFDAIYFYNVGEGGDDDSSILDVNGSADVTFVVSTNTVNVVGGNGIELYNASGSLVKSTAGTTVGISNLPKGIYVAKSGNKAQKIAVK